MVIERATEKRLGERLTKLGYLRYSIWVPSGTFMHILGVTVLSEWDVAG